MFIKKNVLKSIIKWNIELCHEIDQLREDKAHARGLFLRNMELAKENDSLNLDIAHLEAISMNNQIDADNFKPVVLRYKDPDTYRWTFDSLHTTKAKARARALQIALEAKSASLIFEAEPQEIN